MGWCLKVKVPDWEKQVPVLVKKEMAEGDVSRQQAAGSQERVSRTAGVRIINPARQLSLIRTD